jgi:phenylacetate-CoA ligase
VTPAREGSRESRREYWDEAVEVLDREALAALQLERVQAQLHRWVAGDGLFARKLRDQAIAPEDVRSLEDLSGLPLVTKEELRDDQSASPPFGSIALAPAAEWRELHPSTGTTGTPVKTLWSTADVERITDFTARTLWQMGVRPGAVVQNAFAYGLWVAGLSSHYGAARIGCLTLPTGAAADTSTQIDYLSRCGSTVLLATPSYALHIGEELQARGVDAGDISLRIGCFGGEPGAGSGGSRALIEDMLGIDAFDYYGLAEIGPTFASECREKAGIHFAEDHVLVETVDPETRQPVPDGELGVLVFTHLTRQATPLLRYWSNDYARLTRERCACGRTHARAVGGIVGRHDDLVVFRGAKFYPSQVEEVVRRRPDLGGEFRIEVARSTEWGPIARCTVVVESASADADDVRHALKSALGVTPDVKIVDVGTFERTTFKARRLIDLGVA